MIPQNSDEHVMQKCDENDAETTTTNIVTAAWRPVAAFYLTDLNMKDVLN